MSPTTRLRDLVASMAATPSQPSWVDGMSLFRALATTAPLGGMAKPTLALVLQGAKRSVLSEHVYDYRAGQFLVVTVDLPLVSQIVEATPDHPFVAFGMPLQPALIATLLLEIEHPARRPQASPALAVHDADDDLLDAITRLLRLSGRPADYRVLGPGIVREIHWRLLTGAQGAMVAQIGMADSEVSLVASATRWIQQNFDQPMRIDDLAARLGVSVATLNRHFRAVTRLSPLQYQKTMRLQRARLELLGTPGNVARVGHSVGYQSLSQFSREYRRMFGVPPSESAAV